MPPSRSSPDLTLRVGPAAYWPWVLPLAAAAFLVFVAPGPSARGIAYPGLILVPVVVFFVASAAVVGVGPRRAASLGRLVAVAGALLVVVPLLLAGGEALHLVQVGLRGQELLLLAMPGGAIAVGGWLAGSGGSRPSAWVVLVAIAIAAMLEADVRIIGTVFDRDLLLYLRAGSAELHGLPVYTEVALRSLPHDPTLLPFVYPPVTLPFLAVLSILPRPMVEAGWLVLALVASVAGLRLVGVRWGWVPVLLVWPPFVQGLWTGNVNTLVFLAFAAAPLLPSLLVIVTMTKLQLGITSLWLPRERRWGALGRGLAGVAALILVTLPIVGIASWREWLVGLAAFAQTAGSNQTIEGIALGRYIGPAAAILLAVAAVGVALTRSGRDGLASLGLSAIVASPTVYLHGLTVSLPSLLGLRGAAFWFLLAVTASFSYGQTWWLIVAILLLAPNVPWLIGRQRADSAIHPLGLVGAPWPSLGSGSASSGSDHPGVAGPVEDETKTQS